MKRFFITTIIACLLMSIHAQTHKTATNTAHPAMQSSVVLANYDDSVSYALGLSIGKFYQQQGITNLNVSLLSKGIKTVMNKDSALFTDEQVEQIMMNSAQKAMATRAAKNKHDGEVFLAENKNKPNVVTLPDGVQYLILTKGTGQIPTDTSSVKVNYVGTLLDGTEFDNSYKRGQPLDITVDRVIKGWTEILKLMPVGSKWRVWIPSDMGYGDRGAGGTIQPGATLQFDIELLGINK